MYISYVLFRGDHVQNHVAGNALLRTPELFLPQKKMTP